uniref:ADAM metallopeptidase domain 23a n=1 Tax=Astatotilapia calliptera TaxID=8154 RepID=A0AAX7V8U5_ASTCA
MHLIFLATLLVSILLPWLHPSLASLEVQGVEDKVERDAVSALLKQQATAAPTTDNTTHHAVEHVITYPSRLIYYLNEDSESTYHDLNTHAKNQASEGQAVHLAQVSFQLEAFGSRFVLDLSLNNDLLSSDYVEIHYEGEKPVISKGGEHCYYHGQVRGNDNSHAALSTCNGLHVFEEMKYLEVMIVSDHSMVRKNLSFFPHLMLCGWYFIMDKRILFNIPDLGRLPPRRGSSKRHRTLHTVHHCVLFFPPPFCLQFKRHRNKQHTRNFAKSVVNLVDSIFKEQLHTRVVLVAVEIWTDRDHIPISVKPLELLRDFSKYRQQSIKHHADSVQLLSNATFHYRRSSTAYFGGMCSVSRGVGVNEVRFTVTHPALVQHPQKFSKCSISDYKEFLLKGGGSCLFNRPTKLFEAANCGNGFVELGEECDCGLRTDCQKECCKKCSLANGAHCSDGPCCNKTCLFYPRGYSCRYAVNDCDISETCSGDSGQCPPNLHKQDGYICQVNQGRCYSGECKTRENQCKYIWGSSSEKFCYEKLNTEGTEKGNCGKDGEKWIQCSKHDVFCGFLLCTNVGRVPRIGSMKGDSTPTSFNHQGNVIQCTGAHVLLDDETDLGYVEDGTPCGPSMMCLDRKCLPIQSLNMSTCPIGPNGHVCSGHGVCNNEATCTCDTTWAGTDCSMPDPPKEPDVTPEEEPKGPSATNLIIGSIAGAILVAAIVLGGTGWGFK